MFGLWFEPGSPGYSAAVYVVYDQGGVLGQFRRWFTAIESSSYGWSTTIHDSSRDYPCNTANLDRSVLVIRRPSRG